MKQIRVIAIKEFKAAFKDKVFLVITLLFLVLSIVSVYIGSSTKNALIKAYRDIVSILESQNASSLPPAPVIYPLTILANLSVYVSIIGAVLAIFLGFDSFSGERENGTLKLLLTRPLYRDQLVTGKLAGGALVICVLLGVTLIFNTLLFTLVSGMVPDFGELSRLALFITMAFAYMMVFYTATLFVSIRTGDRAFGFLLMMTIWVLVTFVMPQIADSQRNFAYALNPTGQTVTQMPTDTVVSKTIEIFSPAAQFKIIGNNLLQCVADTAGANAFSVLIGQALPILYMITPGVILLFASYKSIQREDAL